MAKKKSTKKTIPIQNDEWKMRFASNSMRSTFCLTLTQPMLEFLCAVADQVSWDRALYFQSIGGAKPDNWSATSTALIKRGLIESKGRLEHRNWTTWEEACQDTQWVLTPAGDKMVELLKVTGIFVEADAAILKKAR